MAAVRPEQIMKILELTDAFNLHREAIVVPLSMEDEGGIILLPEQRLRITVPKNKPFEEWLAELRVKLGEMDLSVVRH